jgi:subtilisin family serine protease
LSVRRALCASLAAVLVPLVATGTASADEAAPAAEADGLTPAQVEREVEQTGNPLVAVLEDGDGLRVETIEADSPSEAREAAEDLRRDDDLVSLSVDQRVRALADDARSFAAVRSSATVVPNYQVKVTGADQAWGRSVRTVTVAVVDTGVDAKHPELAGRVDPGREFLTEGPRTGKPGTVDDEGHGTHVAGIIGAKVDGQYVEGFAKDVRILPIKVLTKDGDGWVSDSVRGIIWAADNGAQLINVSFGGPDPDPNVRAAVRYARSKGALVVAAAGNDGKRAPIAYPAAYPEAISVAATTRADYWASFSSVRRDVDIAAPGHQIVSLAPGDQYVVMSGTSMAAPAATGAIASLMSTGVSGAAAYSALRATAKDIYGGTQRIGRGKDSYTGVGRINVARALHPVLTVQASTATTYASGAKARISASFTDVGRPLAGRLVTARTSTGRTLQARTSSTGAVRFSIPLLRSTAVTLSTPGTGSRKVTFSKVRPIAKATLRTYRARSQRTYRKVSLRIARPARQKVTIQVRTGGRWKTVRNARVGASTATRTYSWKVKAGSAKKRTFRVTVHAGGGLIARSFTLKG